MPQPFDRAWLPIIDHTRCEGCGDCVATCPADALALVDGRATLIHPAACTYCTACEDLCPNGAIALPFLICRGNAET
jgi:thioredoxin reductase (NADPH)